jgi:AcrR family transcriptional regulator
MTGRERWLTTGLEVLAADGAAALKIERLVVRVGLTKGSFFHHFSGMAAYKTALLERLEAHAAEVIAAWGSMLDAASPRQVLTALTEAVGDERTGPWHPELEVAVRAWAFQDAEVAAAVQRIDARRLTMLESVWRSLDHGPHEARIKALLPYLIMVGSLMSPTPVSRAELREVYETILPLVPPEVH